MATHAEGVDYSFARPSPSCLRSRGKAFAVRYVGTPSSGKNLTPSEAASIHEAGLDVAVVYETSAGFMLTADGAAAARTALSDARRLGLPAGRPIYFALDVDPRGADLSRVARFLDEAASVLGRGATGLYAGYAGVEKLVPAHAAFGWQTYAWSGGRLSSKAHLYQYQNGQQLCGGTLDYCRALAPDYGQWGWAAPVPTPTLTPTPSEEDDDMPLTVLGVDGDQARPWMALDHGFVVKFTDDPQLVDTGDKEVRAPAEEYEYGVDGGQLRPVRFVPPEVYDNNALLAKRRLR